MNNDKTTQELKFKSAISGNEFKNESKIVGSEIRLPLLQFIINEHPTFDKTQYIASSELVLYEEKYIKSFLDNELLHAKDFHKEVLDSVLNNNSFVNKLQDDDDAENRTYGQVLADKVAAFGGSWKFILSFFVFILVWVSINVFQFTTTTFDPYPFILLNLILSCIAALQAPVIMMSQNRQEEKDRERAKKDYMINLKSELEIRVLHEKIDHLIIHQQQELIEIQKVQIEMMNKILNKIN